MWQKVFENDAFCGIMHETAAEQKESRSPEVPAEIVILFILMSMATLKPGRESAVKAKQSSTRRRRWPARKSSPVSWLSAMCGSQTGAPKFNSDQPSTIDYLDDYTQKTEGLHALAQNLMRGFLY